jgi:phosphate transport system protein
VPGTPRQHFEQQLRALQQDVLRMGTYVVEMLDLAMQALLNQNLGLADRVIRMDDVADRMDLDIEQTCLRLLALQHPMSKDLRIVGTALKIIADIERIGDYAVNVAKTVHRLGPDEYFKPMHDIARMADCVKALVREALQAYVDHDLERVQRAIEMDEEIDRYNERIFRELMDEAERDPTIFRQAFWFSQIARFMERSADHAVNVAERVHYMETGQFVQLAHSHRSEDEDEDGGAGSLRPI